MEIIARPAQLSQVPYQRPFPGETLKNQQSLALSWQKLQYTRHKS